MELLKEIMRSPGVPCAGKMSSREAVRGIIRRGNALLLVYSTELRDYKFPGGGVKTGETHRQALLREIREETGAAMTGIEQPFGKVIKDLGFKPTWVEMSEALRVNQALLRAGPRSTHQWLARETFVLEQIQQHNFQGQHGQALR
ncbi:MAG: NUDIX domain-containing protein [Anaerolineales bacterium]